MSNIFQIKPSANIPQSLRNIADGVEDGTYQGDGCTVIIGSDVFHLGAVSDRLASQQAIFDMTYGISKLMKAATSIEE